MSQASIYSLMNVYEARLSISSHADPISYSALLHALGDPAKFNDAQVKKHMTPVHQLLGMKSMETDLCGRTPHHPVFAHGMIFLRGDLASMRIALDPFKYREREFTDACKRIFDVEHHVDIVFDSCLWLDDEHGYGLDTSVVDGFKQRMESLSHKTHGSLRIDLISESIRHCTDELRSPYASDELNCREPYRADMEIYDGGNFKLIGALRYETPLRFSQRATYIDVIESMLGPIESVFLTIVPPKSLERHGRLYPSDGSVAYLEDIDDSEAEYEITK